MWSYTEFLFRNPYFYEVHQGTFDDRSRPDSALVLEHFDKG
jgi:hypothetical protein